MAFGANHHHCCINRQYRSFPWFNEDPDESTDYIIAPGYPTTSTTGIYLLGRDEEAPALSSLPFQDHTPERWQFMAWYTPAAINRESTGWAF
jgi:hypothetical protein